MIYLDTDVLVHAYIIQDKIKHREANEVIMQICNYNQPLISILSIQEMLFVLDKLKVDKGDIITAYNTTITLNPVSYDLTILKRAYELSKIIGFKSINDCIHTAIAEKYCSEIITYNKKDFKKINN